MSRVSALRPKRIREKKRKVLFYKVGGLAVVVILTILILSLFTRASFLSVKSIEVSGNKIVQKETVENLIKEELGRSYIKLFSKNNFILFPRHKTEERLAGQFASAENVALSFRGLRKIKVDIKEYEPKYLWCDSFVRKNCYFMDMNAYIFSKAAGFSENVLFTYYGLINGDPIGQTYIPKDKFNKLNSFIVNVKQLKLSPVGLNARGEDDFEMLLQSGGSVLFSDREDYLVTFENLETIIAEQSLKEKNFLNLFDYIDVRFNSKAFVKLK